MRSSVHTQAHPIRLLFIRLALPLILPLPSRFAPSERSLWGFYPGPYVLRGIFRVTTFWYKRGGGLPRQPVGLLVDAATLTTVVSTNCVDSGRFSSRCCALRHTQTSVDPIRLLSIRLGLPLTLFLPSRVAPARLMVFHLGTMAYGDFSVWLYVLGREWRRAY